MPAWEIHIAIANDVMKEIRVEPNSFLIGNVMPDAERYVINDFSVFVPYKISHYAEKQKVENGLETLPNVQEFLKHHDRDRKNSMILGYASHLLADYYWNKLTAQRYTIRDKNGICIGILTNDGTKMQGTVEDRSRMKREDFMRFRRDIVKNKKMHLPEIDDEVTQEMKTIDEIPFVKNDIEKIITYLKADTKEILYSEEKENYQLYTQEQLEKDYQNCTQYILEELKKII